MLFNSRELLEICPFFKHAPNGVFRGMSAWFSSSVHAAHEPVFLQGDNPREKAAVSCTTGESDDAGLFFVRSGVAEVLARSMDGTVDLDNSPVIADMSEGSYFGDVSVLQNTPRTATVRSPAAA